MIRLATQFLFEAPWLLIVVAVTMGLILLIRALGRRNRRWLIAATVVLALVPGFYLLAAAVTTERERLIDRNRQLLQVSSRVGVTELQVMFHADAELIASSGQTCLYRTELLSRLTSALRHYRVQRHRIHKIGARILGPARAESWFQVRTELGEPGQIRHIVVGDTVPSFWHLNWRRQPRGPWLIVQLQCRRLLNLEPDCTTWRLIR